MDYEFELEKFNFKAKTELSSFSDACESRLRDRFHNLFYDLRTTGTSEENLNILQSAKITIDNKPRRALDLVSITVEPEQINFFSSSGQALAGVKEYMISEKGFKKVKKIVTVEENLLEGGFGSLILEVLNQHSPNDCKKVKRLGLKNKFIDKYGSQEELFKDNKLTEKEIVNLSGSSFFLR